MTARFASKAEAAEFWDTHELTEEYIRAHRVPGRHSAVEYMAERRAARQRAEQEAAANAHE